MIGDKQCKRLIPAGPRLRLPDNQLTEQTGQTTDPRAALRPASSVCSALTLSGGFPSGCRDGERALIHSLLIVPLEHCLLFLVVHVLNLTGRSVPEALPTNTSIPQPWLLPAILCLCRGRYIDSPSRGANFPLDSIGGSFADIRRKRSPINHSGSRSGDRTSD